MAALASALLDFAALVLLVRLTLPARFVSSNPYVAAMESLLERLRRSLRPAFPRVPDAALHALLLLLALAGQAALLARRGDNLLFFDSLAALAFAPEGFAGWFGFALLRFAAFWLAILAGACFLRLWRLGAPLPGFSGDLLRLAVRPVRARSLWALAPLTLLLALLFAAVAFRLADGVEWIFAEALGQALRDAAAPGADLALLRAFSPAHASAAGQILHLAGAFLLNAVERLPQLLLYLCVASWLARLFRNGRMADFFADAIRLLTGALPPMRAGGLSFAPLAAWLLLNLLAAALSGALHLFLPLFHVV